MKILLRSFCCLLAVAIQFAATQTVIAQEKTETTETETTEKKVEATDKKKPEASEEEKKIHAAIKVLSEVSDKGDWKRLQKISTKHGADFIAVSTAQSLSILTQVDEMPAEFEIPGMDDFIESVEEVVEKYDLTALTDLFEDLMEEEVDDKKVLELLDKDGKRWQIVNELWNAQKGSMFSMDPFEGEPVETLIDAGKAIVVVKMAMDEPSDEDDESVMMIAPPVAISMKLVDSKWLFDGVDEEKTMELMDEFMEEHGGMMEGDGFEMDDDDGREDF